jgi:mannose-P-dolichol utilization defect protein 1
MQALGYGILVTGAVVKVPQIMALVRSKSAAGLATMSFELENICFIIHASYGYLYQLPINSYGEAVLMLLQNTVLLGYLYRYSKTSWFRVLAFATLNVSMIWAVVSGEDTMQLDVQFFTAADLRMSQIINIVQHVSRASVNSTGADSV